MYEPIRFALQNGGKRIRPQLVLLGCSLCGGQVRAALPAALAVELLHNFTLIHDDIMDSADTRRNQPTVFKKWDANTAILSGDVLFAHAFEQLLFYGEEDGYSRKQYKAINKEFTDAVIHVCRGQAMDMEFEKRDMVALSEYMDMIEAKTAALIRCSLKLGALAAGAQEELIQYASDLGYHTGIAFQIQDDLLDVIGDGSTFGKTIGGDIREGKKTWLTISAFNKASAEQREMLKSVLKADHPGQEEVDQIIELYHELGVIDDARDLITRHYTKAKESLDHFEYSKYKNEINNLLTQLMVREL